MLEIYSERWRKDVRKAAAGLAAALGGHDIAPLEAALSEPSAPCGGPRKPTAGKIAAWLRQVAVSASIDDPLAGWVVSQWRPKKWGNGGVGRWTGGGAAGGGGQLFPQSSLMLKVNLGFFPITTDQQPGQYPCRNIAGGENLKLIKMSIVTPYFFLM